MSRNAIAFMAGLGTGYLSSKEKEKERERQAKKDEQDTELHVARMYELNKSKRKDEAIAGAYAPTVVNDGASTLDVSGKPVLYEDAGVANSDYRQARSMAQSAGVQELLAQAGAPSAPSAPPPSFTAPQAVNWQAGGVQYQDRTGAQAGADAYNTPEAGNKRAVIALRGLGDQTGAMQLQAGARAEQTAERTEADAVANHLTMKSIQDNGGDVFKAVAQIGTAAKGNLEGTQIINRADGKTMQIIALKDGKENVVKTYSNDDIGSQKALEDLLKVDPITRIKWLHDGRTAKLAETKETREAKLAEAHGRYYDKAGDALGVKADAALSRVPLVDRMSEIDKTTLVNINKQRDTIHTTLTKGLADGTLDEAAPGTKRLRTDMASLNLKERQLHTKYDDDQGASPDPAGIRKSAPAAVAGKAITVPNPMNSGKQGQVEILEQEMRKANESLNKPGITPEQRTRAQADIDSLTKEFKNLGVTPGQLGAAPKKQAVTDSPPADAPVKRQAVAPPMAQAPAAKPGPTPQQAQLTNIASALGANSNSAIDKIVGAKAPAFQAASSSLQQAQMQLAAVAKSGDPQALQVAAAKVQGARNAIDVMLKDVNKPQADAVRQAAGYFN